MDRPFEHEARLKALRLKQAELNRALDLDKNEQQAAPDDPQTRERSSRYHLRPAHATEPSPRDDVVTKGSQRIRGAGRRRQHSNPSLTYFDLSRSVVHSSGCYVAQFVRGTQSFTREQQMPTCSMCPGVIPSVFPSPPSLFHGALSSMR
jgi:hypothetical protein